MCPGNMTGPFRLYCTTMSDASQMDATGPIDGYKHVPREIFFDRVILACSDLASPAFSVDLIRLHFLRDTQAKLFNLEFFFKEPKQLIMQVKHNHNNRSDLGYILNCRLKGQGPHKCSEI